MTLFDIQEKKKDEIEKFELAIQIREMLDKARERYGADAWDAEEREAEILALVGDDE